MGKNKGVKHFKWDGYKHSYTQWWNSLTIDQKVEQKRLFELKRLENLKRRTPYPDMQDLTGIRLSQLGDRHISRMHDFKDVPVEGFSKQ